MARNSTIIEEMISAGRGVAALVVGDRRAAGHFDFSQRGLVGSFIAVLVLAALDGLLALGHGAVFEAVASNTILFASQIAATAIVLRQLGRSDGFVPYLVADNWATLFATLIALALVFVGLGALVVLVAIVIGLWLQINIARFIVTLPPMQVAMLIVAQMVAVLMGLFLVLQIFPPPPEALEAAVLSIAPR